MISLPKDLFLVLALMAWAWILLVYRNYRKNLERKRLEHNKSSRDMFPFYF